MIEISLDELEIYIVSRLLLVFWSVQLLLLHFQKQIHESTKIFSYLVS